MKHLFFNREKFWQFGTNSPVTEVYYWCRGWRFCFCLFVGWFASSSTTYEWSFTNFWKG